MKVFIFLNYTLTYTSFCVVLMTNNRTLNFRMLQLDEIYTGVGKVECIASGTIRACEI
jgi:hypothetical protein